MDSKKDSKETEKGSRREELNKKRVRSGRRHYTRGFPKKVA
jgi:hypothetical protein